MPGPENYFDDKVAPTYDADSASMFASEVLGPTVAFLEELAGGQRILELGIGTGRVALPLLKRGLQVHGIELSPEMISQLRVKPGGEAIPVAVGDFSSTKTGQTFGLVYLVFNTIMNLNSQEDQVQCFVNVAEQLEPGGCFVVETMVPELQRLPVGESRLVFDLSAAHVGIDEYDVASQTLVSHHYNFRESGASLLSVPFRYVWPAELDLMARIAGLFLEQRWGDWGRAPFTSQSKAHVSVWRKPTQGRPPGSGAASHQF